MANNTLIQKLSLPFEKFSELIQEQAWFQDLRSKWEELPPETRNNARLGAVGGLITLCIVFAIALNVSVSNAKNEYNDKLALQNLLQNANEELRKLRDSANSSNASLGSNEGPWVPYIESIALDAGIDKSALSFTTEKATSLDGDIKESLFDLSVKKINIKQAVRLAFNLENSSRPLKIRTLAIDTKPDASGYLDATFSVSGFMTKATR